MSDARYAARGVSAGKEEVHAAIAGIDKGLFPKAFCKVVPDDLSGSEEHCLVMHADGAGDHDGSSATHTQQVVHVHDQGVLGNATPHAEISRFFPIHVGQGRLGPSPIGRNKHVIPGEVIKEVIQGTESLLEELRAQGLDIRSTGGETADVGDLVRTIIVDSTVVARMRRSDVIDNANIQAGDVVVGLASDGQAHYEATFNGGMGSNGLTSARHDVFHHGLAQRYPEALTPKRLTPWCIRATWG